MYDHNERTRSDQVFYTNEQLIKKCLEIQDQTLKTNTELDTDHGIDFYCEDVLISYKTTYSDFRTYTFRIPPHHESEYNKLKNVYEKSDKKLFIVNINTVLNMLFWSCFGDVMKAESEMIVRKVTCRGDDGTKMHVAYFDDIEKSGGVVNSIGL